MSSEWPRRTVAELQALGHLLVEDGNHGENRPRSGEFASTGVSFIRAADMADGRVLFDSAERINSVARARIRKGVGKPGDVLLSHKGTVGKVAFVPTMCPEYVCSPQTTFWRVLDHDVIDSRYLFAYLQSRDFKNQLASRKGETDMADYVSLTSQRQLSLPLPELSTQRAIGQYSSKLADRIVLLRETNATLESIAQSLFKSWFVDFDPVRAKSEGRAPDGMDESIAALFPDDFEESAMGLVPKGWNLKPLDGAYEINPTRKLKKGDVASYLDMASVNTQGHVVSGVISREMGSGTKFMNDDTLLARITPCLQNGKTAFVDFLSEGQVGWGSTEFVVLRPKAPLPPYHGYLLCRHAAFREHAIQSMSGTSGRQRVQNDMLGRFPVVVPSAAVAAAFSEVVTAIQIRIAGNHRQAQTLAALRDTLLPRLISGQLRLPEAEAIMEDDAA
jgi:type I restriction enzyme, S subunit